MRLVCDGAEAGAGGECVDDLATNKVREERRWPRRRQVQRIMNRGLRKLGGVFADGG